MEQKWVCANLAAHHVEKPLLYTAGCLIQLLVTSVRCGSVHIASEPLEPLEPQQGIETESIAVASATGKENALTGDQLQHVCHFPNKKRRHGMLRCYCPGWPVTNMENSQFLQKGIGGDPFHCLNKRRPLTMLRSHHSG